ncbi:hypothetical protein ACPA9J_30335 [Pseudomonas aeruginosa]
MGAGSIVIGHRLDRAPGRPRGRCQWPAAGRRLPPPNRADSASRPPSATPVDRGQNALERIDDGLHPVGQQRSDLENRKLVRKTYTLPQNSTLMGSVAMSALIGRVPVDGRSMILTRSKSSSARTTSPPTASGSRRASPAR